MLLSEPGFGQMIEFTWVTGPPAYVCNRSMSLRSPDGAGPITMADAPSPKIIRDGRTMPLVGELLGTRQQRGPVHLLEQPYHLRQAVGQPGAGGHEVHRGVGLLQAELAGDPGRCQGSQSKFLVRADVFTLDDGEGLDPELDRESPPKRPGTGGRIGDRAWTGAFGDTAGRSAALAVPLRQ